MKKYNNYILTEELRIDTTILTEDKTIDLIIQNCKEFIDKPQYIFRGVSSVDNYLLIDPKLYDRTSVTNTNQYNLIIDNTWEGYPKRKNSLCCTSEFDVADTFGNCVYYVIPFDNSKWALSPNIDLWFSFDKIYKRYKGTTMDLFLSKLNTIYSYYFHDGQLDHMTDFETYKSSINKLNAVVISDCNENGFDVVCNKIIKHINYNPYDAIDLILTDLNKENYFDFLVDLMKPTSNDFQLVDYKDISFEYAVELWTESKCFLIREDKYEDLYEKIKHKYEKI
jgi:hypothetical protein